MTTNLYQLRESPQVEAYQWDGTRECIGAPGWVMAARDDRMISIGEDETDPISLLDPIGEQHYIYALRLLVSTSAGKRRGAIRCRARDLIIMDRIMTGRDPDAGEWVDMLIESVPLASRDEEEV